MKKQVQKLRLHRETLRYLQAAQVGGVQGGGNTNEFQTGCACTDGCGTGSCCCGTGSCGCGGSAEACTTGQTFEILSGCATNCGG
jgi:hypothetical protein